MLCVWEGTQERCVSYTKCSIKQELLTQVCAGWRVIHITMTPQPTQKVCVFYPILQITDTFLIVS